MNYFISILTGVLATLYQNAGASFLLAVLIMTLYMLGRKSGPGPIAKAFIWQFKESEWFKRHFWLSFYACIMLFRTVLCQKIGGTSLDDVIGNWSLHNGSEIYIENIENLILFMPLIILFYWAREEKDRTKDKSIHEVIYRSFELSFMTALAIELCQLFLQTGKFKLSDLFFETVGGIVGGVIYWGFERTRKCIISNVRRLGGWDVEPWDPGNTSAEDKTQGSDGEMHGEIPGEAISPEVNKEPRYEAIERLVREAGKKMLHARVTDKSIHHKEGAANFCTDYDMAIQRFLIDGLSEILPGATFFGEEDTEGNAGSAADGEFTFYIDPIDGTTNFMFDYAQSCVSVGLAHRDCMIAGFVYQPYLNDMYVAVKDCGSYLNGRRIVMQDKSVTEGLVEFGCAKYNADGIDSLFCVVKEMFEKSYAIRCGGTAAFGLCRTASGGNTVYLELKLQPYDYAAASVIIEEAGGRITQINGDPITLREGCSIIGGTPKAWQESKDAFAKINK